MNDEARRIVFWLKSQDVSEENIETVNARWLGNMDKEIFIKGTFYKEQPDWIWNVRFFIQEGKEIFQVEKLKLNKPFLVLLDCRDYWGIAYIVNSPRLGDNLIKKVKNLMESLLRKGKS